MAVGVVVERLFLARRHVPPPRHCSWFYGMASAHIQALLEPPSIADAEKHTLDFINSRFKSYQDLEQAQDYEDIVEQSRTRDEELAAKVRSCERAGRKERLDAIVLA